MSDWLPMDSAPKGVPTENAGCRGSSRWFEARVSERYRAANLGTHVIRRRAWPQEDSWEDRDQTFFVPDFFDGWRSR